MNQLRSGTARRRREEVDAARTPSPPTSGDLFPDLVLAAALLADDTLTLLFLCCHPALSPASQCA